MQNHLQSMKNHIDEVAAAGAELMHEANGYAETIKTLQPIADKLAVVVAQVKQKQDELKVVEGKLEVANEAQARLLKMLQQ